jgi:ketosteroid isomerase-like protein
MELRQLAVSPRPTEVIMQHRAAALLFALVVAAACTAPATDEATSRAEADPIAVREAIDAVNAGFSAGLEAGDVEALVAYYDPEAVVMPPNVPGSRGTAAIREGLAGMLSAMTITDMTFTTHDVHVAGDMAVETGAYSMTSQPKDGSAPASTDTGKFLVVWRQQARLVEAVPRHLQFRSPAAGGHALTAAGTGCGVDIRAAACTIRLAAVR